MPAADQNFTYILREWFRQSIFYNKDDIKMLLIRLGVITACSAILTYAWAVGWGGGIVWHVTGILSALVPGPAGPVFVGPIGFLVGLISVFWFDPYKRLQGALLLIPGAAAMFGVIFYADRLRVIWNELTIVAFIAAIGAGLLWGGLFEALNPRNEKGMKRGFYRLTAIVGLIGFWGIIEATIAYQSPILFDGGSTAQSGSATVPMGFTTPAVSGFVNESIATSPFAFVVYLGALGGLVWGLHDFTQYEKDKDVLILGPDRAGKTWLMSGAAFCLSRRSTQDVNFTDPELNPPLRQYYNLFRDREFDSNQLGSNDLQEFDFFRFKFEHGIIPKQKVNVKTIDYAGEHLQNVDIENPWDDYNSIWAEDDAKPEAVANEVPDFETLEYLNRQNAIDAGEIPSLLSAMISEYDALVLTLPADQFAGDLEDDDLPDHLDKSILETRKQARRTPAYDTTGTAAGYFEIYKDILEEYEDKDVFFAVTMSDTFLETFKDDSSPHLDPKGNPNWSFFRDHVHDQIDDPKQQVDFMGRPTSNNSRHYYPVYFEPRDPPGYLLNGEFRPYLDWDDDDYYPLRGLKYLLKRIGR